MAVCGVAAAAAALIAMLSVLASAGEVPMIVANKKASLNRLKSGSERVSVSIDIYNQGSSTVYDVSLVVITGLKMSLMLLAGIHLNHGRDWMRESRLLLNIVNGGILSHSFELEAKSKGLFHASPALITFRIPTKAAFQEAYSTPILPLDVLAERAPENKSDWAKRLLAKYGSQVSVVSIIVLFVYLVASPTSSAKASKKRR